MAAVTAVAGVVEVTATAHIQSALRHVVSPQDSQAPPDRSPVFQAAKDRSLVFQAAPQVADFHCGGRLPQVQSVQASR